MCKVSVCKISSRIIITASRQNITAEGVTY